MSQIGTQRQQKQVSRVQGSRFTAGHGSELVAYCRSSNKDPNVNTGVRNWYYRLESILFPFYICFVKKKNIALIFFCHFFFCWVVLFSEDAAYWVWHKSEKAYFRDEREPAMGMLGGRDQAREENRLGKSACGPRILEAKAPCRRLLHP